MKSEKKIKDKNDHKVIISELEDSPLRKIKVCFALMTIIPLLILFYLLIGKNFLFKLFLGVDGLIVGIAILISILGFFVAYHLINKMIRKMLFYFSERKLADQEKLEVILGLSHDLKTPLTVVRTGLQNMFEDIGGVVNKTQKRVVFICMRALNKTTKFINQMLEISRSKIVVSSLKRELLKFDLLIKNEVAEIINLAKKNSQEVSCKILSTDPQIWGDKEKLSRAVMNLLSNAVKYTDVQGRINVILSSDENTVKLVVVNTGSGIPPDKLNKIFTKYERVEAESKIEGTGLGLYLVKDIIDLHKGHIIVKSIPDKETRFYITLPRDLRAVVRND
jgi:signal transduction histidine kinase